MKRLLFIIFIAFVSLPLFATTGMDSLFLHAVYNRDFESMSRFAEQGVDLNAPRAGYADIMQYYAAKNEIKGVQWCLGHGMDVNKQDSLRATALMHAAINGHSAICKLLIDNGSDTHIRSSYGMTAAEYAAQNCFIALSSFINNPTSPVPHDFYQYRKGIAIALRYADYKKARALGNEAIKYAQKELAPKSRYNVYLLLDLAGVYALEEDYKTQNSLVEEACLYAEKHVPMTEIYFRAKILQCMAKFEQGKMEGILDSLLYYNSYSKEIFGPETNWLSFSAVAMVGAKNGYIKEAGKILYQALDYAVYLADDDYEFYSDYVINTLSSILNIATQVGDADAIREGEMCERYLRSYIFERHDYIAAIARANIGHYWRFIGQPDYAAMWYKMSNEDIAETVGEDHTFYTQNLFNLGIIEQSNGQPDSALVYFHKAKEILSLLNKMDSYTGGMVDLHIATNRMILCMIYPNIYPLSPEIESLFLSALNTLNKYLPTLDLNVASGFSSLALYYAYIGLYEKAEEYATDASSLIERLVGKSNQTYLSAQISAILLEAKLQSGENMNPLICDFTEVATNLINNQFLSLSENSRKELWEHVYENYFRRMLPSVIFKSIAFSPSLAGSLYNCALFSKGILLHTSGEIQSRLREMHDLEIDKYLDAIIEARRQVYEIEKAHPGEYPKEWGQLVLDIEGMESVVLDLGKKYQDTLVLDNFSWLEIKCGLASDQVAIEILKFDPDGLLDKSDSIRYAATIITPTSTIPHYVYLFDESELSLLLNESNKDKIYSYERNGHQLSQLIWEKLTPYIGNARTIFFSPDGLLCQLAVEALPLSMDSVYSDAYNIVRCSSTKYVLQQSKESRPTHADLFGGIQYNMSSDEMSLNNSSFALRSAYRGEMPDTLTRSYYRELPGTKDEVNDIANVLQKEKINRRLFTGTDASEEAFKSLSGTHPNVLHIATHGFYWPETEAARKDYFAASFLSIGENHSSRYVSSMERSGLLFAGANVAMMGRRDELPDNVEDGVLSSQEISSMDLYGTDLVVLSACETGQGDLQGDGVYGLQRAFKQAGAQTIIMSLWKVNDATTQLLMTEFYRNWITNHQSKREAFRNAQNTVRSHYPEPVYWAGFIMLD